MPTLNKVFVTEDQKDYLNLIIHEDSANSIGGEKGELGNSVQWCIDMCKMLEKKYGPEIFLEDEDIRLNSVINMDDSGLGNSNLNEYNVEFYDNPEILKVRATNFTTAGIIASAWKIMKDGVGFGIRYVESIRHGNRVPFDINN